ncbi:MAG: hypothetical protein IPJ86_06055 [Bacteroidetes bacterium]|nr:hypothetical protein [Bacteroidota bacterium]
MTNFLQPIRNLFKGNNELALQPESAKELNALVNLDVFRAMPDQREPIRVFLDDHGYVEAGLNEGSPEALQNGLNHIVSGKYLDENLNEAKHTDYIERMRMLREDIRAKK